MTTSAPEKPSGSTPTWAATLRSPALLLASGLGSGLSPVAPGTAGSLLTLPLAWFLLPLGPGAVLGVSAALLFIGAWASTRAGAAWGKVDHGAIVIDEVVGQLITLALPLFILPELADDYWLFMLGFALFRLFDIVKPWPARYFDLHCKNGWGVMLDDVVAGLMAGIVLTALSPALL